MFELEELVETEEQVLAEEKVVELSDLIIYNPICKQHAAISIP